MLRFVKPNVGRGLNIPAGAGDGSALVRRTFLAAAGAAAVLALAPRARAEEGGADAAWKALAGDGAVALVRHAKAPGPSPDPPGFRIEDCATQRNLSAEGRAQATRLGELWRSRGAKAAKVVSSPWCRCRDTARLMGFERVEIDDALWNLLARPPDRDAKLARLQALIRGWRGPGALVLVTHGITMRALGLPDPGEAGIAVVRPDRAAEGGYRLVGAIAPP
jgi:phosphohistidine phosphatase SixA